MFSKISKRDIGLLLCVFGVGVALMVYSLIYTPSLTEIDSMEMQLSSLQEEQARYKQLEAEKDFYMTEIIRLDEEIDAILNKFPAGVQPESEIMLVVELEDRVDVDIPSINYGTASPISAEGTTGIMAYKVPMGLTYKTTYQGLKDLIHYARSHEDRMVIDSISVAYDATTGDVSGNFTMNLYYMTGTEKVYEDPYVPSMNMGVGNIFGTIQRQETERQATGQ